MFSKCYYDYSMLVSNYQIYYIYVLELSLIWIDHRNTCISRPFIELFVHSISLFYLFIYLFRWGVCKTSWGWAMTRANPWKWALGLLAFLHYLLILSLWVIIPFPFSNICYFWVVFDLKAYLLFYSFAFNLNGILFCLSTYFYLSTLVYFCFTI